MLNVSMKSESTADDSNSNSNSNSNGSKTASIVIPKQEVAKGSQTPPPSSSSSVSVSPFKQHQDSHDSNNDYHKFNYPQHEEKEENVIDSFQSLKKLLSSNVLETFASPRNPMARYYLTRAHTLI